MASTGCSSLRLYLHSAFGHCNNRPGLQPLLEQVAAAAFGTLLGTGLPQATKSHSGYRLQP